MPIIAGFGMLTHTKSRRTNFEVVPDTKKGYLVRLIGHFGCFLGVFFGIFQIA